VLPFAISGEAGRMTTPSRDEITELLRAWSGSDHIGIDAIPTLGGLGL